MSSAFPTETIISSVTTAKKLGIEDVIFEDNQIRAMTPSQTVVLLHPEAEGLPNDNFAISRIPQFLSKLSLVEGNVSRAVQPEKNQQGFVTAIKMTTDSISTEHRLPSIQHVRAPKKVHFENPIRFTMTTDHVELIMNATKAIAQLKDDAKVGFRISNEGLSLVLNSFTGDTLTANITDDFETGDLEYTYTFSYPVKELTIILKEISSTQEAEICLNKGILKTSVNGLTAYLLPLK
jgi:hypothetical protein